MKKLIQSIFQLFALSLFATTLYAKVGPVIPGQALWCIDNRIESTTGVIESKLSTINLSQFEQVLSSEINTILGASEATVTVLSNAISQLETLLGCNTTEITTPTTIATSGVYCLNNNIVGALVVQASDVVINLNSHVVSGNVAIANNQARIIVRNGVIDNKNAQGTALSAASGASDIKIQNVVAKNALIGIGFSQVTDGLIEGCTFTQNTTGVQLNLSHKIVIEESIASGNQHAGFDLIGSTTCSVTSCQALGTGAGNTTVINNTVFGFVAKNGYGNIFERCIANSTQALSTTDFGSEVAGFGLRGTEACSKIIGCEASNATTSPSGVTIPYGILIEKQLVPGASIPNAAFNVSAVDTPQVSWSPDGKYFASNIATISPSAEWLAVFEFDRIRLQVIQRAVVLVNLGSNVVTGLDWSPQNGLIAVADTVGKRMVTYQFQSVNNTLTQVASQNVSTMGTPFLFPTFSGSIYGAGVKWSPDGTNLALADGSSNVIVYNFDNVSFTITQLASNNASGVPIRLSWSPDGTYIAVADFASTQTSQLQIYNFNKSIAGLGLSTSSALPRNLECIGVAWSPNGKYLAVGGDSNTIASSNIFVFQFNRNPATLLFLSEPVREAYRPIGITWSPDGSYVAFAGNPNGYIFTNEAAVYSFDPGTNVIQYQATFIKDNPVSVAWSPDGGYIVIGDNGVDSGTITDARFALYNVLTFASTNVIANNTVYCNSGGIMPQGVGISGSSIVNMIIQNTAYDNPLQQAPNQPIMRSNYCFATNVFNLLFGQAPTALQNISVECCAPNCMQQDIGLTLKQSYSELSTLESSLNIVANLLNTFTSSTTSGTCNPTAITTPTTLSVSGVYCLANSIVGTIVISGSDIFLNLSNYQVSQQISINSGSTQITILNGQVLNTLGSNGISAQSSSHIEISNVRVANSATGINFSFITDALIKDCIISNCFEGVSLGNCAEIVIENTVAEKIQQKGFALIDSTTCCLRDCKALSTGDGNFFQDTNSFGGIIGFDSLGGYGNIFERCIANSTQGLTVTGATSVVAGFRLGPDTNGNQERGTKIIECESSNATTSPSGVTVPYGILLQEQVTSLPLVVSINPGGAYGTSDIIHMLAWSPDGKYLAIIGQINPGSTSTYTLVIYQFDYLKKTLTQIIATNPLGSSSDQLTSVAWSPDGNYLAVGGILSPFRVADDFIIFRFDSIDQALIQVEGFQITTASTGGMNIAWSPDERYLLVGGGPALINNNDIQLYRFDAIAQTATLVQTIALGVSNYVAQIAWSPDGNYVAAGGGLAVGGNDLQLYSFNKGTQTLSLVDTENTTANVSSLAWSPNGKYLGVGGGFSDFNDFKMYQLNRTTQTLQLITSVNFSPYTEVVYSIAWSSDGEYVAITTNFYFPHADLIIYQFDPGIPSLTQVASSSDSFKAGIVCSWSPDGQYIATAGFGYSSLEVNLNIYQALTFPSNNLIKNNTVYCNSGGSTPNGIGISGSSIANMIIQNTAYANPINEFMVPTNYAFAQNVFNQLFGQGPSLLQNISLGYREPISEPGNLGLILKQILHQTTNTGCPQTVINSQNVASGTISITAGGAYCMAQDLTSDMLISGTSIAIDMNNRILNGRVTIQQGTDAVLRNGRVVAPAPTTGSDASRAAITIASTALRAHIENVVVRCQDTVTLDIAGRPGIAVQGNDGQIVGCTIHSGAGGNSAATVAQNGGDGIVVNTNAARGLITNCLITTGSGGNSSVNLGGNGGRGVNVSNSTETKIIKCTILATGAGGTGAGGNAGGIGGHGVNVQDSAVKTMISKVIIRNTGISGLPESSTSILITEGGSVTIPLRSRAINDLISTAVSGISSAFSNTAYNINDAARPYIFQSQLDTLSQGNPSGLPPLANEVSGEVVTGWSPLSNVVFQSAISVLS